MRRRLLDHTYKRTVTGNPAVAKSVARMYPDISFPGFTTQDGEPSPENPVDIVNAQSPVQVEISDGGENIQTVTITSDRPITKWDKLIKQNGVWGWEYGGKIVDDFASLIPEKIDIYENPYGKYFNFKIQDFKNINYDTSKMVTEVGFEKSTKSVKYQPFPGLDIIGIFVNDDDNRETIIPNMHFKAVYQSDSTEFVALSQEEQTMLNALHTNNPTTIVQNSIGTDVTLTYKTKRSLEVTQ